MEFTLDGIKAKTNLLCFIFYFYFLVDKGRAEKVN